MNCTTSGEGKNELHDSPSEGSNQLHEIAQAIVPNWSAVAVISLHKLDVADRPRLSNRSTNRVPLPARDD